MRYRLRTLLILLAVAPPLLAPVIAFVWARPYVLLGLGGVSVFAVFWLGCGMIWLTIMQIVEWLSGEQASRGDSIGGRNSN
jgi:hypothetical protein